MSKGIIYVCSTVVEGLIKIGRTTDFDSRMSILEKNGYANVTALKRHFAIEVDNHEEIEQLLHDIYSKNRVGNTELFSADINQVVQLRLHSGRTRHFCSHLYQDKHTPGSHFRLF